MPILVREGRITRSGRLDTIANMSNYGCFTEVIIWNSAAEDLKAKVTISLQNLKIPLDIPVA